MKVKPISILIAALFSASALAAGPSSQDRSAAPEPKAQSSEQSQPTQSQASPSASGQSQAANPELVKQAQEKLSAAGHDAGPSDGVMGPKTQAALKKFQESKGMEASGQLDQETLAALEIDEAGSASAGSSSSTGASSSPSSESGSQPPSQPGATGKQQ